MAERSLESLAAHRGITICFVELDGADGLWVPEERTVLLSRALSDRRAAEVLEHELSHVDIEDGHAALDTALVRRRARTRWLVAATAAVSLTLLAGIKLQLDPAPDRPSRPEGPVAGAPSPSPAAAGQPTVSDSAPPSTIIVPPGETRTETVTVTPSRPPSPAVTSTVRSSAVGSPAASRSPSPSPSTSRPPPIGATAPSPTLTPAPTPTATPSATSTAEAPAATLPRLLR